MKCYFCGRPLPEPGHTHIVYVHVTDHDGTTEERPVCQNELHTKKARKTIARLERVPSSKSPS